MNPMDLARVQLLIVEEVVGEDDQAQRCWSRQRHTLRQTRDTS